MKVIPKHPNLYLKYKDKIIKHDYHEGCVVGYFLEENNDIILICQTNTLNHNDKFDYFVRHLKIVLKDYHGNPKMDFFLINKESFK